MIHYGESALWEKSTHTYQRYIMGKVHNIWSGGKWDNAGTQLSQACINGLLSRTRTLPHADVALVDRTTAYRKTIFWVNYRIAISVGIGLDFKPQFRFKNHNKTTRKFRQQLLFKESSLHFPRSVPSLCSKQYFQQYEYSVFYHFQVCGQLCQFDQDTSSVQRQGQHALISVWKLLKKSLCIITCFLSAKFWSDLYLLP